MHSCLKEKDKFEMKYAGIIKQNVRKLLYQYKLLKANILTKCNCNSYKQNVNLISKHQTLNF
jgi:hypothetical protein